MLKLLKFKIVLSLFVVLILGAFTTQQLFAEGDNDGANGACANGVTNSSGYCGPAWTGSVTTQTGAPLAGAQVAISCSHGGATFSTNGTGYYTSNVSIPGVDASCNPITLTATYNNNLCQQIQVNTSDTVSLETHSFVCNLNTEPFTDVGFVRVSGFLTNNGAPVSGAQLVLQGPQSGTTTSDLNGWYHFDITQAGNYTLTQPTPPAGLTFHTTNTFPFTVYGDSAGIVYVLVDSVSVTEVTGH